MISIINIAENPIIAKRPFALSAYSLHPNEGISLVVALGELSISFTSSFVFEELGLEESTGEKSEFFEVIDIKSRSIKLIARRRLKAP